MPKVSESFVKQDDAPIIRLNAEELVTLEIPLQRWTVVLGFDRPSGHMPREARRTRLFGHRDVASVRRPLVCEKRPPEREAAI